MAIKWLHISDVHECDREDYHRVAMYDEIVAEVKRRQTPPHIVFVTGDLAFAATEKEYDSLQVRFFDPLKGALPDECLIFMVPGNHDVDRQAVVPPRLWIGNEDQMKLFQEVSEAGKRKRGGALLPRFAAYSSFEKKVASWGEDWIASECGSICHILAADGVKIAVVGINTAWLCQDNEDWGKLTAGRTMMEAALRQAEVEQPDLIIVLGHHPIEAMMGEQEWSDGSRIRQRLEQTNAVYLHGHLHVSGTQTTGDSLHSVLSVQAPSAFQAGDNRIWRNGLMWGEVDLESGWLNVEPLKWNDADREYKFDTDAGRNRDRTPGRDAFRWRLPGRVSPADELVAEKAATNLPLGWRIVDREALAELTANRPDARTMAGYFDGTLPNWHVALAEGVRPRQIVDTSAARFQQHHTGAPRPFAALLTGAGGEGKSTALFQVVATLVRDTTKNWTCLHREAAAAEVPERLFEGLEHRENHAWIVALDDAENAGRELVDALRRIAPRTDVHLLLAAREADWLVRGLTPDMWRDVAEFRQDAMPGLDEEDARRIIEGWQAYGDEAMGRLRGTSGERAAKALLGHANEHAARPEEGCASRRAADHAAGEGTQGAGAGLRIPSCGARRGQEIRSARHLRNDCGDARREPALSNA